MKPISLPDGSSGFTSSGLSFGPFLFRLLAVFIRSSLEPGYTKLFHIHWAVADPIFLHVAFQVGLFFVSTTIKICFAIEPHPANNSTSYKSKVNG
jgi:hypothetical protein